MVHEQKIRREEVRCGPSSIAIVNTRRCGMSETILRAPTDDDWPAILALAETAWVIEYEVDRRFISYLQKKGFVKLLSFDLEGTPVVELSIDAPFQSLAPQS
jgi:hypothetical protein